MASPSQRGGIQAMCQSFNSTTCKDFEPSSRQPPFQRDQFFNRGSAAHKPSSPQKKPTTFYTIVIASQFLVKLHATKNPKFIIICIQPGC
jgi:hypothetical protein